ncbi:MAG: DUF4430 domain-containing protein [Acutalibacteraceae bacterium]
MKKISKLISAVMVLMLLTACSAGNTQNSTTASEMTSSYAETTQMQTTVFQTAAQTTETTVSQTTQTVQTTQTTASTTIQETTFQTETVNESSTGEPQTEAENKNVCFLTIDCRTIKNNLSSLKSGKQSFVTQSGYILKDVSVAFENGDTAFDILKNACKENVCTDNCQYCQKSGVQLEYSYTPAYESYYVEGIHQLYEKDCGSMSGWLFSVNGVFPDYSSSSYQVKNGDKIVFAYTCDGGEDVGNSF